MFTKTGFVFLISLCCLSINNAIARSDTHIGSRGGVYHYSKNGNKVYEHRNKSSSITGTGHFSSSGSVLSDLPQKTEQKAIDGPKLVKCKKNGSTYYGDKELQTQDCKSISFN